MGKNNLQINLFSKKRVNIMNLSKEGSSSNWNLIVNPRWKKERKHFSKIKLSFCAGAAATPLIISFFFFSAYRVLNFSQLSRQIKATALFR